MVNRTSTRIKVIKVLVSASFLFFILGDYAFGGIKYDGDINGKKFNIEFFGFYQTDARIGKAFGGEEVTSLYFSAPAVRVGTKYTSGNVFGKLLVDFSQDPTKTGGNLREVIKDVFTGYSVNNAFFVKLGMMKTPVGLLFTTPGWNYDIPTRDQLEKNLALERSMGVMVSGRFIGLGGGKASPFQMGHEKAGKGFGYDVGLFNPAGRSGSVKRQSELAADKKTLNNAYAFAARVHFDYGEPLHFEASYGLSQKAGGKGTSDYNVLDVGVNSFVTPALNLKAEYISGSNINGIEDNNQSCLTGAVAYHFSAALEAVVHHYQGMADPAGAKTSSLGNTFLGVNLYLNDYDYKVNELDRPKRQNLQNTRLQLALVLAQGGDDWTGNWGYTDTGLMLQMQHKF